MNKDWRKAPPKGGLSSTDCQCSRVRGWSRLKKPNKPAERAQCDHREREHHHHRDHQEEKRRYHVGERTAGARHQPRAFSCHGRRHVRTLQHEPIGDDENEQDHEEEGAERQRLRLVRRDEAQEVKDARRIDEDALRDAEQLLDLEGFERSDRAGDKSDQQCRRDQRQGHAAHRHPQAGTRHRRCLFIRRVDKPLRRLDQNHHDRDRRQGQMHPGNAAERSKCRRHGRGSRASHADAH